MIYLIRHGQTEFNREGRYQGGCDSPLTALGEAQARQIGRRLSELTARETPIISSPLGRARATAELVRETGRFTAEIVLDGRLAEVSMGSWDGLTRPEIEALQPGFSLEAPPLDWYMRSADGETYDAFAARLSNWLAEYRDRLGPWIVVSHGVVSRVLRGLYLGLTKDDGLTQSTPQDAFFRLDDSRIERLDCAQLPSAVAGV
jgi:broad specificity phosphatase PhoE